MFRVPLIGMTRVEPEVLLQTQVLNVGRISSCDFHTNKMFRNGASSCASSFGEGLRFAVLGRGNLRHSLFTVMKRDLV